MRNKNLISISGYAGSGKDTVAYIIQLLIMFPNASSEYLVKYVKEQKVFYNQPYEIRKWADKLKDIVCLLLNCTREQLEDRVFKETPLGQQWWCYNVAGVLYPLNQWEGVDKQIADSRFLVKMTPRLLLQKLGTEGGRNLLHPNIWVNSLMAEYIREAIPVDSNVVNVFKPLNVLKASKWIITDTRFPNELEAIQRENGISIRVNVHEEKLARNWYSELFQGAGFRSGDSIIREWKDSLHESETALDNATFDYVIQNNGTYLELINNVKRVLIDEGLI